MATSATRKQWREEILAGVEKASKYGVPGLQVVCGENSEPILTGNSPKDVVISAAELGQGRLVVFTQGNYTNKWFLQDEIPESDQKIIKNILSWVTKGNYTDEWRIIKMTNRSLNEAEADDTVLIWNAPKPNDAEMVEDLIKFISGGGNVILGVTPWGYTQVHKCDIDELSCYPLLRKVEIFLTDGYNQISGQEIDVANNKAEEAHVGDLLQKCKNGEMKISELSAEIIAEIGSIPDEDREALLKEHLSGVDVMKLSKPPLRKKPLKTNAERAAALFVNLVLKSSKMTAPGVEEFPGDFESPPQLSCVECKIESHCNEAHPVGAYLPPGGTAIIEVLEGNPDAWKVQIGCHSDNLRACDRFKRWPDILVRKKLEGERNAVHSPFGGSVYLLSPKGDAGLSVRIKEVVASPVFHLDDTAEVWNNNRNKPGLWADFVGRHIMLSVPSKSIRNVNHPVEVMEFWDDVVITHHDLKGKSLDKKRKEWIVPDIQPNAGSMHSGWPIVTRMDAADPRERMFLIRKPQKLADGHWGYFHELGHNMQEGWWTFAGAREVTCNIFSMHVMEKLFNMKAWDQRWLEGQKKYMKKYLKNGPNFEEWQKHPGIALGIYAQLARDFGFETYKKVFRHYQEEKPRFKTDQEKIDYWVTIFSQTAEANVAPAYKLWGIPVSEAVITELAELKEYLPDDEVTEVLSDSDEKQSAAGKESNSGVFMTSDQVPTNPGEAESIDSQEGQITPADPTDDSSVNPPEGATGISNEPTKVTADTEVDTETAGGAPATEPTESGVPTEPESDPPADSEAATTVEPAAKDTPADLVEPDSTVPSELNTNQPEEGVPAESVENPPAETDLPAETTTNPIETSDPAADKDTPTIQPTDSETASEPATMDMPADSVDSAEPSETTTNTPDENVPTGSTEAPLSDSPAEAAAISADKSPPADEATHTNPPTGSETDIPAESETSQPGDSEAAPPDSMDTLADSATTSEETTSPCGDVPAESSDSQPVEEAPAESPSDQAESQDQSDGTTASDTPAEPENVDGSEPAESGESQPAKDSAPTEPASNSAPEGQTPTESASGDPEKPAESATSPTNDAEAPTE